jgi:2-keto-3-deoxy-L-rhamnonate aldolase RhmA
LQGRQRLLGTVLACRDPALAELAGARFDFAWIDLEHSPLDLADMHPLALALTAAGCAAMVRLPSSGFERLPAILDTGIDGVVIPRVRSANEAAELIARMHYPPAGTRGFAARRAAGYGRRQILSDDDPVCWVQIESRAAVAAAQEIAGIDGVDALVVGTSDLALDLQVAPDLGEATIGAALATVRAAAHAAGAAFGVAAGGDAHLIATAGGDCPDLIVYSADVRLYAEAVDDASARLRAALSDSTPRSTDAD